MSPFLIQQVANGIMVGSIYALIAMGVAMIYGVWLIYAAGPNFLLMCALLYAPGVLVYWWARKSNNAKAFSVAEALLAYGIFAAAALAAYLMWTGTISAL
mgnify:CR=1 FL=1